VGPCSTGRARLAASIAAVSRFRRPGNRTEGPGRPACAANAFQHGRVRSRAWGDESLRWLVDPGRMPEQKRARDPLIGTGDVTRFRATVDMFADLDNRFGGGHAREAQ
jgi:hypothetical protein